MDSLWLPTPTPPLVTRLPEVPQSQGWRPRRARFALSVLSGGHRLGRKGRKLHQAVKQKNRRRLGAFSGCKMGEKDGRIQSKHNPLWISKEPGLGTSFLIMAGCLCAPMTVRPRS